MCLYSTFHLQWEKENLSPYAVHSDHLWYTMRNQNKETDDDRHGSQSRYRSAFEIDKDRITNSQVFRRLEYKTQVFVTHEGDNYRTRLTHSLEVSEIARHIARSLRLNENLVEAIALGHDIGHAPYGHIAERTINKWLKDLKLPINDLYHFCHNNHSVENVDNLEPGYDWDDRKHEEGFAQGLNLTLAVREGLLAHTSMGYRGLIHREASFNDHFEEAIRRLSDLNRAKGLVLPGSLEAQAVRIADDLAQRIHDLEDGLRSGMLHKNDICQVLKKFFTGLAADMFGPEGQETTAQALSTGDHLIHKVHQTKVCKRFIHEVVTMLDESFNVALKKDKIGQINDLIKENNCYRDAFVLASQVAFLLHMWRDKDYLQMMGEDERKASIQRVFKYLKFLYKIIGKNHRDYPAYHIIAFLRGAMLANVIEHSYYEIHSRLDPLFRTFSEKDLEGQNDSEANQNYAIFVVADGFTTKENKQIKFEEVNRTNRIYCFEFKTEEDMHQFCKDNFEKILKTNGTHLKKIKEVSSILERVCWLNKSRNPEMTRQVRIIGKSMDKVVRLDRIKIYFTGYKDLCPGIQKGGTCTYSSKNASTKCSNSKCRFWWGKTKYPDINRLIRFQDHMLDLDMELKNLISNIIHKSSRVARMNYMGEKIIRFLLDSYLKNPRLMHDRVWSRLRIYQEKENVDHAIREWVDKPVSEKENAILPEQVLNCLTDLTRRNKNANHFSLVRRVVEHVAGMTDRYISNEYNRLNQSGRETEKQDETYFFY